MPNRKSDAQLRGERTMKDPNPNTLVKGQSAGGYMVETQGPVPLAGQPIAVRAYPGEWLTKAKPWAPNRPKSKAGR